ncbi:PrpF domain-containing protein [Fredinandcohnia sp. QZ13]|uniref:PrpF domain-containing protein n=1 Tax=Fredinandcohnia sp. QZ13 TaxID=3073144 RepID=UPI0028536E0E|nr:PrpF domain-containing protein [Fredinandcohnia sp. QZ13]MDR4887160.1 PrpF domain-containing protein [Fredinandcohnia sp. QZ13]
MSQFSVRCVVYRGGTSRGLFFHEKDLPINKELQHRIFLEGIDAYNPSQINGLGSGTSHSSKVMVISEPTVKGADLDYTFYQIGIGEAVVDDEGTCGNLMAAVGAFAVDEGLVQTNPNDDFITVSAFNKNINKLIEMQVPLSNGNAKVSGEYLMPGIVTHGAKIIVNILSPGGGKTGKTIPIGLKTNVATQKRNYATSFVDIVNPFVYVAAKDFGLSGSENNSVVGADQELLSELEEIRLKMAVASGVAKNEYEAKSIPSIPKIALVASPHDYVTSTGKKIKADDIDIVAKMISMKRFHRTFAGSGLYNLAASALLEGTIPNHFSRKKDGSIEQIIRIGHPEGIAEVRVNLTEELRDVASVGLDRTARRIVKGDLYIPEG